MKSSILGLLTLALFLGCKESKDQALVNKDTVTQKVATQSSFEVSPISHATMVIQWDEKVVYVDPVGGASLFSTYPAPDLVLVTDIHGDHMNAETLQGLNTSKASIVVPKAVADKLPESLQEKLRVIGNGETKDFAGIKVEAVPMYNLREEALKFHSKGRGNGYVLELSGERVYISGDTEDIPEMRSLQNIDRAFVCMNLPYTMTVESAASAVLEFKPKMIYPYHYRGGDGLSDVDKFKEIVNTGDSEIAVVQLDWYKK